MGWFSENKPKTGSGTAQPKGTRTTGKVKVTFRKPDGAKIQPAPKKKK